MSHEVACPKGHRLQVTEAHFNKQVHCPTCGEAFVVPDLGAAAPAAGQPAVESAGVSRRFKLPSGGLAGFAAQWGRTMLLVGLVLVVFARGCDVIAQRGVSSAQMKPDIAKDKFDDKWDRKSADLEKQIQALDDKKTKDPDDSDKKSKLQEQLRDLKKDRDKEWSSFRTGTLRSLAIAARDADANNRIWGYWRSMAFVAAAVVLALGVLSVSFTAQGAERNVCLALMAIITFSVYVAGVAWVPIPAEPARKPMRGGAGGFDRMPTPAIERRMPATKAIEVPFDGGSLLDGAREPFPAAPAAEEPAGEAVPAFRLPSEMS